MALFDIFKKKKEKERFDKKQKEKIEITKTETREEKKTGATAKASNFILKPHITEKATKMNETGAYIFKIAKKTNKTMVKQAIKETYGTNPRKISIINIPSKKIFLMRRKGIKPGIKKAIVYLKKGEKIEIA